MRRFALLLGLVASLATTGGAQQQADLTPEEARIAAARLLTSGHPQAALDVTSVLIKRDPDDGPSLIVQAQALRSLGRYGPAQQAARRAWAVSQYPLDRYASALAMAQSLSADGKRTRAQLWLRRAAQVAPNAQLKKRVAQDYAYLRRTNPWSVNLSFGIRPSDNINNAPRDNKIPYNDITLTAADPIAGFEVRSDVRLRYNFAEKSTQRHFFAFGWTESHVYFTGDDSTAVRDESDLAYRRIEGTFGRDFTSGPDRPRQTISLSLGRIWSGHNTLADEVRVNWRQSFKRPEGRRFSWSATLGYADRKDTDLASGFTGTLDGRWSKPLKNGGRLGWNAGLVRVDTDSPALTHSRLKLGVDYTHPNEVFGAIARIGMRAELRRYDDPTFTADPRQDERAVLSASLLFVDFDTYGFAPKLTLEASRTDSNVPAFETQNLGLQIGFQSLF